jgi:hypothetical protein
MHGSWLVRSSVGRGRSSPLRRGVDRAERIALAVAVGLAVLAVPVAVLAGAGVQRAADAVAIAQNATAHPVTALLLRDAPYDTTGAMLGSARTLGEWHTLSGSVRTGQVDVPPGSTAGTSVSIWIDDAGRPVAPPLTEDQAYWRGVVTVIMVLLGLLAAITATFCGLHWVLNRRRLAQWAADWRSIEPHWSGDH